MSDETSWFSIARHRGLALQDAAKELDAIADTRNVVSLRKSVRQVAKRARAALDWTGDPVGSMIDVEPRMPRDQVAIVSDADAAVIDLEDNDEGAD